ncbi:MAG: LTA synthase family protein [Bacteroidia bacterium]|nr:LTA synthase family protein [Bacteroidia bacterium]
MKKRLIAVFSYALFWLIFFFIARLIFIVVHWAEASQFSFSSLAGTFWHGLKLDISATGYILLIPMLFLMPGVYFNGNWYKVFLKWYTYIIVIISSCIVIADTLLYKYWGFRMDYTPLLYLSTPKDAAASVTPFQMAGVISGIILLSSVFIFLYWKFVNRLFDGFERIRLWLPAILFFALLFGSLILPIRGGIGVAPINAGTVYFSENMFVNHTAINVVWNVGNSAIYSKPEKNPYEFTDLSSAKALMASLISKKGAPVKIINNKRPNILFLILESFGNALIGPLGGDSLTTPNFNRFCKEGILFTKFYSSGYRTDKSTPAILNGYPAQPAVSIMKDPRKTQSLPGILKTLNGLGYNSAFWYGGDLNFANFHSYVRNSGFKQIITQNDFNSQPEISKWGVPDHILFEALKDSMKIVSEPFLKVVLTLSSHEPFDVPIQPFFQGNDEFTKFRNSIYYVDKALGEFLDWAKKTEWWKNTLVVVVADHYRRTSVDVLLYSEEIYRIPMLWLGGALAIQGSEVNKIGSQVDIPLTVLHQLDLDVDDNYPFSKDLLSEESNSFAFYIFNEGFGFITDTSKYIYDHKLGRSVLESGANPEAAGKLGKAYLEVLYDDYMKR